MPPRAKKPRSEGPSEQGGADGRQEQHEGDRAAPSAAQATGQADTGRELDRRQGMADIARRRAAHFANYADEDEEAQEGNVHVGGNEARKLGMWSSAVELVNAREQARAARERQLMSGGAEEPAPGARQAQWAPSRDPALGPRPHDATPSLFDLAMRLVVEYIEDVESLWGIPDVVKSRIAAAVCRSRRLSPSVLRLFTEEGPTEVSLPDCTQIGAPTMADMLLACATTRLVKLDLGLSGRSMTDETAASFAAACGGYPAATTLRLSGAYRLSDQGLLALLRSMPALQELSLPQCSRLAGPAVTTLPQLVPNLRVLDLDECRGLDRATIGAALAGLPSLESVVLNGIPEADDDLMAGALAHRPQLQRLSLCNCAALTDRGIAAIAQALPGLLELRLDECTKVTSQGILALAERCKSLQHLSLRRLTKVEDDAIARVAEAGALRCLSLSGMGQLEGGALAALALYCKDSLQELDISWCRKLSNEAVGHLADSCTQLATLSAWGCTQLTEAFLLGHSNDRLEVLGRGEALLPVPPI